MKFRRFRKWLDRVAPEEDVIKEDEDGPQPPPPALWETTKQDKWWQGYCMNVMGSHSGMPQHYVESLIKFLGLDPDAPKNIQPYTIFHTGGINEPTLQYYEQMKEIQEAGTRVIHITGGRKIQPAQEILRMRRQLDVMKSKGFTPYAVSIGNEPELQGRMTALDYSKLCSELYWGLEAIAEDYGVKVAMPCLSSVAHAAGAYGAAIRDTTNRSSNFIVLLDQYGHVQPKNYVIHDVKDLIAVSTGLHEIIIKESGDRFHGAKDVELKDRVIDENAGEFRQKMCMASVLNDIPSCPFLWWHEDLTGDHYDDISIGSYSDKFDWSYPKQHGTSRREGMKRFKDFVQLHGNAGLLIDLELTDPRGK